MFKSKKHIKTFVIIIFSFVLASYLGWQYFQSDKNGKEDLLSLEIGIITNMPFPNTAFLDSSNRPFQNENIQGGQVLLVYLVDGCDACSDEVSIISDIQNQVGLDVKVWGIVEESSENIDDLNVENKGIPIIVDIGNKLREELKIRAFPYNLLLNDGVIVKKWIGVKDKETLLNQLKN